MSDSTSDKTNTRSVRKSTELKRTAWTTPTGSQSQDKTNQQTRRSAQKRSRPAIITVEDSEEETGDNEEEEPAAKRMATSNKDKEADLYALIGSVKTSLDQMNDKMCTKKDLDQLREDFSVQLNENTSDIRKLFSLRENDMDNLHRHVQGVVEETMAACGGAEVRGSFALTADERDAYMKCRRSLRMWPIQGNRDVLAQEVRKFTAHYLAMSEQLVANLKFEKIWAVDQPRRSKITDEVVVQFQSTQQRDIVQSHANNLSKHTGKAGIRLEVPQFLEGAFKGLMEHAATLNATTKDGIKRSIKFDDKEMSLCLDIKLPTAEKWHRFSYEQIREASKLRSAQAMGSRRGDKDEEDERRSILMLTTREQDGSTSWRTAGEQTPEEVESDPESK